jgi:hypothetical protein
MPHIAWNDAQLKRWMRPDARRFIRPDWRRYVVAGSALAAFYERYERKYRPDQPRVPAGVPEGGQWTGVGGGSPDGGRRASMAGSGKEIVGRARKGPHTTDRPKVSEAANDQSKRESRSTTGSATVEKETQIAARISPELQEECELQKRKDDFICKAFKSAACYGQAMLRYANCLRGLPIPPLNF